MSDERRKYEAVIVLSLQGEEGMDELINSVGRDMEAEGVKLDRVDKIGKKQFAYNARKQGSGYFVNYHFDAVPNIVTKLQERLRLNTSIYLQYYQRAS
jgi:small subunit ribosomal protein S6